jgi:hypothetical protein
MKQQGFCKIVLSLGLALILAGVALVPRPARASMEDAAIFYDELKDQGEWVDYGNYGPVWYPTKVQENWRPYVDGRWTPSEEGYVFETQEPWAPSTYHYGNWMPTQEYGWVWVPGRTWYPNTVSWRTSPDSASPEASYVGWAPVPPSNYTPAPGYYPQDYTGGGAPYGGSLANLLTAPFWIFIKGASFLLGLNSPYSPAYSYWGSNSMVPIQAVPYYYSRTVVVNNYYSPGYYPGDYLSTGGYYNWGPPIPYVARVTHLPPASIYNYMREVNIYHRRNVVPPPEFLARRPWFRETLPPAMLEHHPLALGARFHGARVSRANLVQPNLVNAHMIKNAPALSATIPKAQLAGTEAGPWRHGVPGAALPASATMQPSQAMQKRIKTIPSSRQLVPVSPSARHWNVPQTPGAAALQTGTATKPVPYKHGYQGTPTTLTPGTQGTPQAVVPQEKFKRGVKQGPWGKHEQTPQAGFTPGQYPQHKHMKTPPPGTAPATTAVPQENYPQRRYRKQPLPQSQQQQAPVQTQPYMRHQPQYHPQQVQQQQQLQPKHMYQQPPPKHIQPQVHQPQYHQPQGQPQGHPQGFQKQQEDKRHYQQNQ